MKTTYLPPLRLLQEAVRTAWSGQSIQEFKVDNAGWTNLMREADGRWMFRIPRWPKSAQAMSFEVRLLKYLGQHLSIRVPSPLLVSTLTNPRGWPFMAYPKLPGVPLADLAALSRPERARLSRFLIRLFTELADLPRGPLRRLGAHSGDRAAWSARFEKLQHRYEKMGVGHVPAELDREITQQLEGIRTAVWESHYHPVLLHNDLWPNHILWDRVRQRPVGVIDWEDARFGDPAFDLTTLDGIGADFMEDLVAVRRDPQDDTFNERLLFYRRILPLHGLLFGIETGRKTLMHLQLRRLRASLRAGGVPNG